MKMSAEELGKWVAENPTLHSARVNGDVETIVGEARFVFEDPSISEEDVNNAAKAYHTAAQAAAHAQAEAGPAT